MNRSFVGIDDTFGNGESQSCSVILVSDKRIEDGGKILGSDSAAIICDGDLYPIMDRVCIHTYRAPGRIRTCIHSILGILQKVQ